MNEEPFGNVSIPDAALASFEKREGIPLEVISELFRFMKMSKKLQKKFWQEVASKDYELDHGDRNTISITTFKDGKTKVNFVQIVNGVAHHSFFWHPRDMKDNQLAEFKRASNHNKMVTVSWQKDGDKKPINGVTVSG